VATPTSVSTSTYALTMWDGLTHGGKNLHPDPEVVFR